MAIIGKVKFWNLGRSKAKGVFNVVAKDEQDFNDKLEREFSKYLLSSDISFERGKIYAGFHKVGNFAFLSKKLKEVV